MDNEAISQNIKQAIKEGVFPGAVLLCAKDQKIIFHESFGMADVFAQTKMMKTSIFDLASLTKPLSTTLAISKLVEKGRIYLDQKIESILTEFKGSDKAGISIDMLLRHTSGLPAHRDYFNSIIKTDKNPKEYLRYLLAREPLESIPGTVQVYSDLGFMVLSWVIEKITRQKLDQYVLEQIYSPLGIEDLFFINLDQRKQVQDRYRPRMVATQHCPWRGKILKGEVDDDNAWAVGGIEGHAGLFGDARAVYTVCQEILNALQGGPVKVLDTLALQAFVQKKKGYDRVAGFDTPSKNASSAGRFFSPSSVGHLGFTGTSFWIDPETSVIIILLTNRVHPKRSNEGIKIFRPQIHDLIYSQLI